MKLKTTLLTSLILSVSLSARAADTLPLTADQIEASGIQTVQLDKASEAGSSVSLHGLVVLAPGAATGVSLTHEANVERIEQGNLSQVKAGQTVLKLHSSEWLVAQKDFLAALSESILAEQNFARDEKLFADGLIPQRRLQQQASLTGMAKATFDSAKQQLLLMGAAPADVLALQRTRKLQPSLLLRAPVSGQVSSLKVQVGQSVAAGQMLFQIVDAGNLELNLSANSLQATQIAAGDKVLVDGCAATGQVIGVGLELDPESQSVPVRVGLSAKDKACLKANQIVQANVQTQSQQGTTAYLVPASAVITQEGGMWVFARKPEGFLPVQVTVLGQEKGKTLVQAESPDALQPGLQVANAGTVILKGVWAGLGGE